MARKKKIEMTVKRESVGKPIEEDFLGGDPDAGVEEEARDLAPAPTPPADVSSLVKVTQHGRFTVTRHVSLKATRLLVVREDARAWAADVDLAQVGAIVEGAIVWADLPRPEEVDAAHVERVLAAVRSSALAVKTTPPRRAAQPMNREAARAPTATHRQVVEELAAGSASPRRDLVIEGVRRTMDEEKL